MLCMYLFALLSSFAVDLASVALSVDDVGNSADEYFDAARKLSKSDPKESLRLLKLAAEAGHSEAQSAIGVAYAQGQGGAEQDMVAAMRWFRAAAFQGHSEATFNLVALCNARPRCLEATNSEQAFSWLQDAASQGLSVAAFEAGNLLLSSNANDAKSLALDFFVRGARAGHAGSMYNAAHLMYQRHDLTGAVVWFGRAASQQTDEKVAKDAASAVSQLRRLWVQQAEASDMKTTKALFDAARLEESEVLGQDYADSLARNWSHGITQWNAFEESFQKHASYDNTIAISFLRDAMSAFEFALGEIPQGSELLRYLLLSKLAEGGKALSRDDSEIPRNVVWVEEMAKQPLCKELYAQIEADPSCFNDQLASAIVMRRRMNATAQAEELLQIGQHHPHAATKWLTSAQVPRVFSPHLEATRWWDPKRFDISEKLEAAWASGDIVGDLARIDEAASGPLQKSSFQRIVSSAAPIRSSVGADIDASGVWSEFMLFNGTAWLEEPCKTAVTLCNLLSRCPEVSGDVVHSDGTVTQPQGQVTIFRLRPGAHVLPHVGVTNRRLVLQFPLRGWHGVHFRVDQEWRQYREGKAMVFDDSFEHEVVHKGEVARFVLYAVLHHPDLGVPKLRGGRAEL